MKRFAIGLSVFFAVVLAVYSLWAELDRAEEKKTGWSKPPEMKTRFPETILGADSGRGNIIGIQPWLSPQSYATALNFAITLRLHIAQLQRENLLGPKTILVFPAHVGSGLLLVNEKQDIYDDSSLHHVFRRMARSNLFRFAWQWFGARGQSDRTPYALFCMKAAKMAGIYQQTFSELAKTFGVTIVAGSILLPEPSLDKAGNLITGKGSLYNTTAVFGPDGNIRSPLVRGISGPGFIKPSDDMHGHPAPGLFSSPAGKIVVAVIPDGLRWEAHAEPGGQAGILLVPAGDSPFRPAFSTGNTGGKPEITAVGARSGADSPFGPEAARAGIHKGMAVYFTGSMWSAGPAGGVAALRDDSTLIFPGRPGRGMMVNLWLH